MTALIYALDPSGKPVPLKADANGRLYIEGSISLDAANVPGLDIPPHDYIAPTYTGEDLTGVVYKTGGEGGATVATLTLAYSSGKLASVTKS